MGRQRVGIWSVVAPIALIGVFGLAILLVTSALDAQPPVAPVVATDGGAATVPDASVPATYTARKGDTISGIAERYGLTSDWILRLNPQVDPVSLAVGTRLNLREPAAP